jgi:hypothetical protein
LLVLAGTQPRGAAKSIHKQQKQPQNTPRNHCPNSSGGFGVTQSVD